MNAENAHFTKVFLNDIILYNAFEVTVHFYRADARAKLYNLATYEWHG